jgi:hypothetical protein
MDKQQLTDKIKNKNYSHEQLLGWVNALPGGGGKVKPIKFKKGDVHMHPIFNHPYVLLDKKDENWICGLLTTESTCPEILSKCKSRFFSDSYFTKMIFTTKTPIGSFMMVYENPKHIKEVLTELKEILK